MDDTEVKCGVSIHKEWKAMHKQRYPRRPALLMRMISDMHGYNPENFHSNTPERRELERLFDAAYDSWNAATRELLKLTEKSEHYFLIPTLLSARMPQESLSNAAGIQQLTRLQERLEESGRPPVLGKRLPYPRIGAPVKGKRIRILVQVICWYLVKYEGQRITSAFDKGDLTPTGRAGILIEATLKGMGQEVSSTELRTHLNAVKEIEFSSLKFWDLAEVLHSSKDQVEGS